mgnify:CR=1 FL=1
MATHTWRPRHTRDEPRRAACQPPGAKSTRDLSHTAWHVLVVVVVVVVVGGLQQQQQQQQQQRVCWRPRCPW